MSTGFCVMGYTPATSLTWCATVQISGVDVLLPVHVSVGWFGLGSCRLSAWGVRVYPSRSASLSTDHCRLQPAALQSINKEYDNTVLLFRWGHQVALPWGGTVDLLRPPAAAVHTPRQQKKLVGIIAWSLLPSCE